MICEKCKKNNATFHYRYNENGNITEFHLCSECAKSNGLLQNNGSISSAVGSDNGFINDGLGKFPFSALFGSSFGGRTGGMNQKVCPGCGLTEAELRSKGKLGCEKCYSVFSDFLNAMLKKMHMSLEYKGKTPVETAGEVSAARRIEKLRDDMQAAVEKQNYEEAAKIRDMIKELESSKGDDTDNVGGGN